MRIYAAAFLISMAFVSPAMAIQSAPGMTRPPSICDIGRPDTQAQRLPVNEVAQPGRVLSLRGLVIRIVLRLAGCRVATDPRK